jgi:hypothetical protein
MEELFDIDGSVDYGPASLARVAREEISVFCEAGKRTLRASAFKERLIP